jgi:putative heme-binding domain-containing protein
LAQFELVGRGSKGKSILLKVAQAKDASLFPRLHALWGLGQLGRSGKGDVKALIGLLRDTEDEVRANAARVIGDLRLEDARDPLIALLADKSLRVRSLAAIALGRVCKRGDAEVIASLYQTAATNTSDFDVVLRHSCLSALDHLETESGAAEKATSSSVEERMMAVLFLRRHHSPKLVDFLSDADLGIRTEVIRAIYDSKVLDTWVGDRLAALDGHGLAETVQRRIVGANYRKGTVRNAKRLVALAADAKLHKSVRQAALHGLRMWEASIDTDPVLGHYRPQVVKGRTMKQLGADLTGPLRRFISRKQDSSLTALATKLAGDCGVALDLATSRKQVVDASLDAELRVATLDSIAQAGQSADDALIMKLLEDKEPLVQAAALLHGFNRDLDGVAELGYEAVKSGSIPAARSGVVGLAHKDPAVLAKLWSSRDKGLRPELWLDAYLALSESKDAKAKAAVASFAAQDPYNVFFLSTVGGDSLAGGLVFRNQGACLQCHKIGSEGGVQGPDLSIVAERLKPSELLQSVVNPGAVITEGYGLSSVMLKDGSALVGRVPKQTNALVQVITPDGKVTDLKRSEVASITPPVSPMPPLGMTLPPRDLRNLIAFLASQTAANGAKRVKLDHGKKD